METLKSIYYPFNSYLTEKEYNNASDTFIKLIKIASCFQRTDASKKKIIVGKEFAEV